MNREEQVRWQSQQDSGEGCWEVDKENLPTRTHYSSRVALFNWSICLCLIFFSSPSLFLLPQFVILFQSASSTSFAFLHWLLSPTASFCFPCLQLALQLTPSTPQHLNCYWHITSLLTQSSPMKPTYSSLATLHSGSSKHLQNTGDKLCIDQCIISKKTVIFINTALKTLNHITTTTCCKNLP